jgi:hypothetical protein
MIAIGTQPLQMMLVANRLIDQGDGSVTVELIDGQIMSVNPDGGTERRPAGTSGPWERAVVLGNLLVFRPSSDRAFAFAFAARVRS